MVGVQQTKGDIIHLREIRQRTGTAFQLHGLGTCLHVELL